MSNPYGSGTYCISRYFNCSGICKDTNGSTTYCTTINNKISAEPDCTCGNKTIRYGNGTSTIPASVLRTLHPLQSKFCKIDYSRFTSILKRNFLHVTKNFDFSERDPLLDIVMGFKFPDVISDIVLSYLGPRNTFVFQKFDFADIIKSCEKELINYCFLDLIRVIFYKIKIPDYRSIIMKCSDLDETLIDKIGSYLGKPKRSKVYGRNHHVKYMNDYDILFFDDRTLKEYQKAVMSIDRNFLKMLISNESGINNGIKNIIFRKMIFKSMEYNVFHKTKNPHLKNHFYERTLHLKADNFDRLYHLSKYVRFDSNFWLNELIYLSANYWQVRKKIQINKGIDVTPNKIPIRKLSLAKKKETFDLRKRVSSNVWDMYQYFISKNINPYIFSEVDIRREMCMSNPLKSILDKYEYEKGKIMSDFKYRHNPSFFYSR